MASYKGVTNVFPILPGLPFPKVLEFFNSGVLKQLIITIHVCFILYLVR